MECDRGEIKIARKRWKLAAKEAASPKRAAYSELHYGNRKIQGGSRSNDISVPAETDPAASFDYAADSDREKTL